MYLQLDDVKQHLNIDLGYTGDDRYILNLVESAEEAVSRHINMDFSRCFVNVDDMPYGIRQLIKILVATWYNNREGTGTGSVAKLPLTFDYLAGLYINYDDCSHYAITGHRHDRCRENE